MRQLITFLTVKSSTKDIDDSLYWDHTLIKYRHPLPMDISRTEMYYTHQPILTHILLIKVVNDSASDTSCWWKQRKSGPMIAIDYHNSCETPTTSHSIPERSFQIEEVQEVKIFCHPERLQPRRQAKHNSMRQTALNSSSNSCCCYIWTCQSDQEKKKKMNQTPSNWQSQIQSWMCWFQDQYEKHSLQMFVQGPTTEDGDVSTKNWKLLTVYFQVMKGEIVTQGRLLKFPCREDRMPWSASHAEIE